MDSLTTEDNRHDSLPVDETRKAVSRSLQVLHQVYCCLQRQRQMVHSSICQLQNIDGNIQRSFVLLDLTASKLENQVRGLGQQVSARILTNQIQLLQLRKSL